MDHLSKKEVQELASQLRSPEGKQGIDVGQKMHEPDISMAMSAVDVLELAEDDIEQPGEQTPFQIVHTQTETEQVESKDGSTVERTFTTITLKG